MTVLDKDKLIVLPGGTLPVGGASPGDVAALGSRIDDVTSAILRGGIVPLVVTGGVPNWPEVSVISSFSDIVSSFVNGDFVSIGFTAANTGPVQITIAGIAAASPVLTADGQPLTGGEIVGGRNYVLQRRGGNWRIVLGDVTRTEVTAAVRDAGILPLANIGGTGDAITADLAASALAIGITSLSGQSEVDYIPVASNSTANPTLTIGGATFDIRAANGNAWPARAFVVGRAYKLRRRGANVLRVVSGATNEATIDQAGVIRLVSVAGSDAMTAEVAPGLEIQSIAVGRVIRWRQADTNAAASPTLTVNGVTRQVQDTSGSVLAAGALLAGRNYMAEVYSDTTLRLLFPSSSAEDIAARTGWMTASDAKWADRAVHIEAETPQGYAKPASTTTIITSNGDMIGIWKRSGNQGAPPAEGRVLTANDGYWIRVARLPKAELVQPVLDSVQQVVSPQIQRIVDTNGRVGLSVDAGGGIHAAGLDGLSVQDHVRRQNNRYLEMKAALAEGGNTGPAVPRDTVRLSRDFGADPTGVADSTSALNRAYLELSNNPTGPRTIILDGHFALDDRVTPRSGVNLVGLGWQLSSVRPRSYRAAFDWRATDYLTDCIFSDFKLNGIGQQLLNGSYTVQAKGFYFQRFRRCIFTRLWIVDTGATSIGIDYADDSWIGMNLIERGGRLASYGQPGASGIGIGTGKLQSEPLIISGNIVRDCRNYNIFHEQQGATSEDYRALDNIVTGNICIGGTHSYGDCGVDATLVEGNQFRGALQAAVIYHNGTVGAARPGNRALLRNNVILDAGGAGVEWQGLSFKQRGYASSGNRIEGCAGPGHWIRGSTTEQDDFQIDDTIIGNGGPGIHIESGRFSNVDIGGRIMNNGGNAIQIGASAEIRGGSIGAKMRDLRAAPTQTGSIAGAGLLTDVMINGCQGVGCAPANLTNPANRISWGFNPGVKDS